jgi:hypothetical protein
VLFIGKAQEKTRVFRTERRHNPKTGVAYPWLVRSTAMVNHYYIYGVDRDFGPFFLKFCTYFPYTAKLYLNGHEWLKQQLKQRGIGFESLDNGLSSWTTSSGRRLLLTACPLRRLMPCCGSGCAGSRTRSRRATARPAIATTSRFCRRSFP